MGLPANLELLWRNRNPGVDPSQVHALLHRAASRSRLCARLRRPPARGRRADGRTVARRLEANNSRFRKQAAEISGVVPILGDDRASMKSAGEDRRGEAIIGYRDPTFVALWSHGV